ncbi:hypothetical protein DEJ49_34675 [Streptomyces venezuelae]|uniref:Uncharacterized protein n=1 Tax=Streptomyces venezuelae TaxID=54571 RepID=A0A5P2CRG3_STRVZ|nr:hypothetical protein DEJ49_34675 [Streptomyces venezuelae]
MLLVFPGVVPNTPGHLGSLVETALCWSAPSAEPPHRRRRRGCRGRRRVARCGRRRRRPPCGDGCGNGCGNGAPPPTPAGAERRGRTTAP